MLTFKNLNQALIGLSQEILTQSIKRETRGFICHEIPYPVLFCIENPTDRYINIKERKWNKWLPFAESLWLARGRNDMQFISSFAKNLMTFSDDGNFMRAGYGSRLRQFNGIINDYLCPAKGVNNSETETTIVDQFDYVLKSFERDKNTRQAVMTIHDPAKDCFSKSGSLKVTKDQPCTRLIQFMIVEGKLDCIVYLRSNDLIWGLSAVNVFNFTWMQEYFAMMIGVPIGKYYHFSANLHVYDDFYNSIQNYSELDPSKYVSEKWEYNERFDLSYFDAMTERIEKKDKREFNNSYFFDDWNKVLRSFDNRNEKFNFRNPLLEKLFND